MLLNKYRNDHLGDHLEMLKYVKLYIFVTAAAYVFAVFCSVFFLKTKNNKKTADVSFKTLLTQLKLS